MSPRWNNVQDYYETVTVAPTHWRPLPDAPKEQGEGK